MKERDARGLSQATQAELRRSAVRMRKAGKSRSEVGLALGVHVKTITRWTGAHKKHGSAIFAPRKRGRRTGEQRDLSPEQEGALQKMIAEKTPDQLKLAFALWTRRAVCELMEREFAVRMPVRTCGGISAALGIYAAEASAARLRAESQGGPPLDGGDLPGDCGTGQGAKGRDSLG